MLYEFASTSSVEHTQIALFKANNREDVAKYILDCIKKHVKKHDPDGKKYLDGMCSLEIGCCGYGTRLDYDWKTKDKVVAKYLSTLTVDEFLEVLDKSHVHSGGDIDEISITEFNTQNVVDLTKLK